MGYFVELLQVNIQKESSVEDENTLEKDNLFHIFEALKQVIWNSNKIWLKMTKFGVICNESKCYANLLMFLNLLIVQDFVGISGVDKENL